MSSNSLSKVIIVDANKCVGCHACITACPVKYCNDGSGDVVEVNPDMCIACGKCITACTHDARSFSDDFERFINDIIAGEKIVAISAPAVAASFPEMYLQLNTWLKQLGVDAVFDVSFGAELTTKSYIDYIQNEKPQTVIAQPCAAIVTYIELYQPELIKYLAPVDSPMLHTIKMIQEFYPQYKHHKVAVISPCNAKKREFEETGLGDYNIAHQSVKKFLEENKINLAELEKTDFDNPPAERAVLFSSPGGLLKTAERWIPDIADNTRKIEGTHIVYDYFKSLPEMIEQKKSPLLIDCLSCDFGCNAGPLTDTQGKPQDEIEYYVNKRSKELKQQYLSENENNPDLSKQKIEETLDKYWKKDLYKRTYVNRWKNVNLKYPNKAELKDIYTSMHKYTDEDIKNCSSCGYGTCEAMATAIFNKLNKPENCHFYLETENITSLEKARKSEAKLKEILNTSVDGFVEVDNNEIITEANPAFKKILKKSDIVGRQLFDFIDAKNKEILEKEMSVRKNGIFKSYELEFKQSDGKSICCLISASPIFSKGEKSGSFAMISDISKLKEKERQLKEFSDNLEKIVEQRTAELHNANKSLEQLSIVASETDNAIMIMDKNGKFEWVNKAYTERYGRDLEELIKTKGESIQAANNGNPEFEKMFAVVTKDKKSANFKKKEIDAQGKEIYSQITLTPILDDNNELRKIVSIKTDISEMMQKEQALMEQTAEMEELLEELHTTNEIIEEINNELEQLSIVASETDNAIVIMDGKGNFEWVNDAFTKTYGMYVETLIEKRGKNILEANNYSDLIKEKLDIVINDKKSAIYQQPEINANGDAIYTQTTLTPVLDENDKLKKIVAINSDITALKEAEEEIRQKNEEVLQQQEELLAQRDALADSEEQIKYILHSLPDAAFVIDRNGVVTFWNKAVESMTGVKAKDIIGKGNFEYAVPFYGEAKPILIDLVKESDESLKRYTGIISKDGILQAETFVPNLRGEERYLIGTASTLQDSDGEYAGAIEIIHDITRRKKEQEKIENQRDTILLQSKEITDSINYAARIQSAVLPPESHVKNFLPEGFIFYKPKDIVGGDFYWIDKVENKIIIVAADCTGHGVPGGFMSMLGVSFLNEIILVNKILSPDKILNHLRKHVINALRQETGKTRNQDGMDISLCVIDRQNGILEFAGAYNPLFLIRNNELTVLKGDRMPIGIHRKDKNPFTTQTCKIEKDDTIYLFSDGFIDQIGITNRKFMIKNFRDLLLEIHHEKMNKQKQMLQDLFEEWRGDHKQIDDVLIMGFRL